MSKGMSSRSVVWRCSPPAKRLRGGARGDTEGGGGGGPVVIWGVTRKFCNFLTHAPLHNTLSVMLFCFFCCWRPTTHKPESLLCYLGAPVSPNQVARTERPNAGWSQIMPHVGDM